MDMEKGIIAGLLGIVGVVMIVGVAQAMTPQPQYSCPLCPEKFLTYEELYQHFITQHPSMPIDIIWE